MSTQNEESPIANLIEDLGMNVATEDATDEGLNLNDSEKNDTTSTVTDEDVNTETSEETPEGDTETKDSDDIMAKITALEEKQAMADKRLADKDKYINELKQQIEQGTREETVAEEDTEEEDFWDNPEKKFADVVQQLKIANLRIDEQAYASGKKDYWDLVNADKLKEAFVKDPNFQEEFNKSPRPYESAYNYLKSNQDKQTSAEEQKEKEIEARILAKYGLDKKNKSTPVSINNIGNGSSKKTEAEDGFSAVFGNSY